LIGELIGLSPAPPRVIVAVNSTRETMTMRVIFMGYLRDTSGYRVNLAACIQHVPCDLRTYDFGNHECSLDERAFPALKLTAAT
jgi:hypothetical protein